MQSSAKYQSSAEVQQLKTCLSNNIVKLDSDAGSWWRSQILDLWPVMGLAQTFIVCLLAILVCPIISKSLQRLVRGGNIRTDLDGTLITLMGVQEKVGRVDLSGDPAFAPQNPNTPLGEQDPQMFIFAIPRTVIAVRFKVGAD